MSTSNMPANFKRYTVSASTDNGFKVLRWNDNWTAGWGSGYHINAFDGSGVWSLPYTGDNGPYSDLFLKSFGSSQQLSVVTRTDNTNETEKFGFMKTSATPITISAVSGGTSNVGSTDTVAITITLSGGKSGEEHILVRYTINDWASSSLVTATGSGTSYTATIPAQSAGTTVKWYALTSTVSSLPATNSDLDFLTLSVMNNSGSNYSYQVISAPTVANPTATSIATTSATLGGNVTAGTGLTARGTVWGTSASPTGNSAAEGGTSTGVFTHSRTGLTANTLYTYRAYATNAGGTSYSSDANFTTLPNAPTVGSASSVTAAGFTASWTAPTSQGSASFTYSIEVSTNNSTFASPAFTQSNIASGTTTASVTGLSSSTTYYFRVRAVNAGGNGAWSSGSAAVTTSSSASAPAAPTGVSITPGNQNLSVSFTAGDNGGAAISNYKYSIDGASFVALDPVDTTSPVTVPNSATLTNGQSYNVRILAVNSVGDGTATANVSATPRTTPSAPTITGITIGNGNLSVAFTAPSSNGGDAITNYQYSTNGGTNWQNRATGTTASPLLITTLSTDGTTALTNGTSYNVQIRAVNGAGSGTATASTAATPLAPPSVTTSAATSVAGNTVTLGGDITATGGVNPTIRGVEYSTTNNFSDGTGTQVSSTGNFSTGTYTHNITGLTAGTTYYFKAFATNTQGTTYGSQATFTTAAANYGLRDDGGTNIPTVTYVKNGSSTTVNGTTFNGTTIGTSNTLTFTGSNIKIFKSSGGDVANAYFDYKIWLNSASEPADYTTRDVGYVSESVSGGTTLQEWSSFGSSINILSGLTSGTYNLKIRFRIAGTGNAGTTTSGPFTATFALESDYTYNIASGTTTESAVLGGSGNLTKSGAGELLLTGANTYTGNTTISSGTLRIQADSGLGGVPGSARSNSITLGTGTLALNGAITLNSNRGITLTSTSATIDDYGDNDTYNGIIANSGTAALTKVGGAILTLGGVSTYTGNTTISVGQVEITNASALGAGGTNNGTIVASGAALRLSNGITVANELLTLNGTGVSDGGALRSVSGNNAWSSTITLAANARINSDSGTLTLGAISGGSNVLFGIGAGNITISGAISGAGASQDSTTTSIFKDGAGTLTLTAANNYTGDTRIVAGNLTISGSGNLGSGSDIFVSSGARLDVDVSTTVSSISETGTTNGGTINIGSGAVLTINGASAGNKFHHTISGAGSLVFSGTGDSTLSVYNTASYTGNTTVNSGLVSFDIAMSTPNIIVNGGTFRLLTTGSANSANITIASGGVFDVDAQTTAFTMGSGKVLTIPATGADTTATIRVAQAKDFTAYSRAITFSNFGSSNSTFPLTMGNTGTPPAGGQGAFLMNSTSTVTINTSTQLGAGTYKLIGKSSAWGVVTNDSLPTPVITGAGAVGAASLLLAGTDDRELFLVIAKGSSTISATGTTSFTYTGSAQGPDGHSKTGSGGAVTFSYVGTGGTSYGPSATKPTNAGTYSVNATVAADSNYEAATSAELAFTIAKAASTISATGSTSFTYSGSPQGPDGHSKTGSGGAVTFSYAGTGGTSYTGSATKPTNVGTYSATATVAADSNYEAATSATYAFSITKANQATVTGSLGTTSLVVGNTTTVTASGGSGSGAYDFRQNGGNGTVSFTGSGSSRTVTADSAGTAPIEVRRLGDTNYNDSGWVAAGTITITAAVPAQVTLSRADTPVADGFTVKWSDVANETGYHLNYSTNATFASSVTAVTNIAANATSYAISGLTPGTTYYVRVRGVSAGGNGTWSNTQSNQIQSVDSGVSRYMSLPGSTASGNYTIADIFGSSNEAGLTSGTTAGNSTVVFLLNASGGTANTIFYNSSAVAWREGEAAAAATNVGAGKAFILQNNSGSTDYFLLVGTPRDVAVQPTVSINDSGSKLTLVTTGRTSNTPLADLNLNPGTGAGQFKAATQPKSADRLIVPPADPTQPVTSYWYNSTSGKWYDGLREVPSAAIPAGQGFFIKKSTDSTFSTWTMPQE
jgi:autotransporter-associated beta strand protein